MADLAHVPQGFQRIGARESHPRHRHGGGYAAIVLSGQYEEWGCRGRWRVEPGDVLFHDAFEAHGDRFGNAPCTIYNLPLAASRAIPFARARCRDVEAAMRSDSPDEAAAVLMQNLEPVTRTVSDWPDRLVEDLARDPALKLSRWAERHGLSSETLSRGLRKAYGVAPARLRAELRAQKAWALLARSDLPMAMVALDSGFADQAHMSRDVSRLTGRPPSHWRKL